MAFIFSSPIQAEVTFEDEETREQVKLTSDKRGATSLFVFRGNETVRGKLELKCGSKSVQHQGIAVELIGQIDLFYDRGNHYEFTSVVKELEGAGTFSDSKTYNFEFSEVDKQHDSYDGINARLRYFLRVTVRRQYATNITKEFDFWVVNSSPDPEINNSIKMEVGIEDCLHIEFEYNKSKYHLKDVVIGKVFFLLVRIKIKHMEIALIKRESTGSGPNLYTESETITKFEVMDGAPVRGESIPIRMFLGGYDLSPTFKNLHGKFSVRYYLNLVLVDEEGRRYFKQQEISLYRPAKEAKQIA